MKAKIDRLEAQLLPCGQSLETCEPEKASKRAELRSLEDVIGVISDRLKLTRGESSEKDRTIDGLNRAKTDLEQTIRLLRVAVGEGLLTTNSLNSNVERLNEDSHILSGAAPPVNQ